MRIAEINVPKGCEKIYVNQLPNGISITYDAILQPKEFYCKETQELEMRPGIGDFAILWDDDYRNEAIVACILQDYETEYYANNGVEYANAIKFRNYEQYLAVRGIHE